MNAKEELTDIKNYLDNNGFRYAHVEYGNGSQSFYEYDKFYRYKKNINIQEFETCVVLEFQYENACLYREKYHFKHTPSEAYPSIFFDLACFSQDFIYG